MLPCLGFGTAGRCCGLEGRSGCSHWEHVAGQHHELLQERWGSNSPTPSSQEIHTLWKNRSQKWGLKPRTIRDLCPGLGQGDMAWRRLSLRGVWVNIHLSVPPCWGSFPQESCWVSGGRGCFPSVSKGVSGLSSARPHPHCSSATQSPESALAPTFIVVPSPDLDLLDSLFLI